MWMSHSYIATRPSEFMLFRSFSFLAADSITAAAALSLKSIDIISGQWNPKFSSFYFPLLFEICWCFRLHTSHNWWLFLLPDVKSIVDVSSLLLTLLFLFFRGSDKCVRAMQQDSPRRACLWIISRSRSIDQSSGGENPKKGRARRSSMKSQVETRERVSTGSI